MAGRIVFVGAGAVGSYVGGHLARAGNDVTLIDPWPEHIDRIKRHGLRLSGRSSRPEPLNTSTLRPYAIREYGPSKPILPGLLLYLMTTPYVTNGYSAATRLSRE